MTTEVRARRLRLAFKWACGWLAAQGLLNLVMGESLAYWMHLRFQLTLLPYVRQAAVAQLALALLLSRAVQDPRRQALAVDVLLLAQLAQVYLALSFRLSIDSLVPFEWLSLLANATLAGLLIANRTRSSQMAGEATILSAPAKQWLRHVGERAIGKSKIPLDLGKLGLADEPAPPLAESAPPEGTAVQAKSKAVPHMD